MKTTLTHFVKRLRIQMTVQILVLAAFAGLATPPAAAGDTCSDDSWGAGWEYTECGFSCEADETLTVISHQQDRDWVDGLVECDNASAQCGEYTGSCYQHSSWSTGAASSDGKCEGSAYSNFATDAHLICKSGDGGAEETMEWLFQTDAFEAAGCSDMDVMECSPGAILLSGSMCTDLMQHAKEVGYSSAAYLRFGTTGGDPDLVWSAGLVWSASGCTVQQPECTLDDATVRCSIQ